MKYLFPPNDLQTCSQPTCLTNTGSKVDLAKFADPYSRSWNYCFKKDILESLLLVPPSDIKVKGKKQCGK